MLAARERLPNSYSWQTQDEIVLGDFVRVAGERYIESTQAVDQSEFLRLWLTDAVILRKHRRNSGLRVCIG